MPVENKKWFCGRLAFSPTQHFELLTAASELFTRWKLPLYSERRSDRPMGSWLLLLPFCLEGGLWRPREEFSYHCFILVCEEQAKGWFCPERSGFVGSTNIYGASVRCVSNTVLDEVTKGLLAVRERGLNAPCLSGGPRERQREGGQGGTEGLAVMVTDVSSPRRR